MLIRCVRTGRNMVQWFKKGGISNEYVCTCTGVERKGNVMAEIVNRAKPSSAELQSIFGRHISEDALVLCDGLKSYLALEGSGGCSIKDISMGESGKFYNLNTVNNFHSFIKRRYTFYRGVATKYLNRYNGLFSFAYKHTEDKVRQLCSKLLQVDIISRQHTIREVRDNGLLLIWLISSQSPHFLTNTIYLLGVDNTNAFTTGHFSEKYTLAELDKVNLARARIDVNDLELTLVEFGWFRVERSTNA